MRWSSAGRAELSLALVALAACEPLPGSGLDGGADGEAGAKGSCAFEGTYTLQKTTYAATGGTYCNRLLTELAANARAGDTLVMKKVDLTTFQSDVVTAPGTSTIVWTLDAASCQLRNSRTDVVPSSDSAGAPVNVKLDALNIARLNGQTLALTNNTTVTSSTAGAQGFPCNLDSTQTGTKQ